MSQANAKSGMPLSTTAPARKPVKPERYDRRSVKEYEDEGYEQAIEYFRKAGGTFRKDATKSQDVRSAIDKLPADTVLQATMSDFWLRLTKTEGRKRRKDSPPPSPFVKNGRNVEAKKQQIEDWDAAWLAKEAARVFAKSGSSHSRSIGEMLRSRLPWLTASQGAVIGCVGELPVASMQLAMKQPEKMHLQWLTLEEALHRRWTAVEERGVWLSRFKAAYAEVVGELERRHLNQVVTSMRRQPSRKRKVML